MREPSLRRMKLAKKALGATITFRSAGDNKRRKGEVMFADYDTLIALIELKGGRQQLVSLAECRVIALRGGSIPVLHGARLDVWQHVEGWEGVGIGDSRVADVTLEPLLVVAA